LIKKDGKHKYRNKELKKYHITTDNTTQERYYNNIIVIRKP